MTGKVDEIVLAALEPLRAMAQKLSRTFEEAEDLVQETCIRALRNAERLEGHPCPRAYLFRVLRNLSYDRLRLCAARPQMISMEGLRTPDGDIPQLRSGQRELPSVLRDSLDEDVQAALERQPEVYRTALWLREIDGLSYEEIAEALNIPPGTVRSRLSRARARMGAALAHRSHRPTPDHADRFAVERTNS